MSETLRIIATIFYVLAAVLAGVSVFLFFKLKIPEVYRYLTGKQKKIKKRKKDLPISEQMKKSGNKIYSFDNRPSWRQDFSHRSKPESADSSLFGDMTGTENTRGMDDSFTETEGTLDQGTAYQYESETGSRSSAVFDLTESDETMMGDSSMAYASAGYGKISSQSNYLGEDETGYFDPEDSTDMSTGLETTVFSDDQTVVEDMVFIHTEEFI